MAEYSTDCLQKAGNFIEKFLCGNNIAQTQINTVALILFLIAIISLSLSPAYHFIKHKRNHPNTMLMVTI